MEAVGSSNRYRNSTTDSGGFLKSNAELIGTALRFFDLTIIVVSALIANYLRFDTFTLSLACKVALIVALFAAATLFPMFELYKPWRGMSIWLEIRTVVLACICVALIIPVLAYLTKTSEEYSRIWFGYWILLAVIFLVASRLVIRHLSRWARTKGFNSRNILIVGAGDLGQKVSSRLHECDWIGLNVVGFLDDNPDLQGADLNGVSVLGGTARLGELVDGPLSTANRRSESSLVDLKCADQVWVALPVSDQDKVKDVCSILEDSAIPIVIVPDLFMQGLLNHSVDQLAGMPVVNLRSSPIEGKASTVKLVEDILISLVAIMLTAPLMAIIALLIKLESPGPILFKQRRYGINGRGFMVWKFRTMYLAEEDPDVPQAKRSDPRITRIGAILRKTSLDELPQFFNVLQGHMSVVGPRPHAVAHNEKYRKVVDHYMLRSTVKPGITGLAQVNGWRGETDTQQKMEKRVECDLEYLNNWSVWLDIKIVFRTIVGGFMGKNAY